MVDISSPIYSTFGDFNETKTILKWCWMVVIYYLPAESWINSNDELEISWTRVELGGLARHPQLKRLRWPWKDLVLGRH